MSNNAAVLGQSWVPVDTFGARLALIRQTKGWNISEAAKACGVPAATWGAWEAGSMPRDIRQAARRIARAAGCDELWLLGGGALVAEDQNWKKLMASDQREPRFRARNTSGVPPVRHLELVR